MLGALAVLAMVALLGTVELLGVGAPLGTVSLFVIVALFGTVALLPPEEHPASNNGAETANIIAALNIFE